MIAKEAAKAGRSATCVVIQLSLLHDTYPYKEIVLLLFMKAITVGCG